MGEPKPVSGTLRTAEGSILKDVDGRSLHMQEMCGSCSSSKVVRCHVSFMRLISCLQRRTVWGPMPYAIFAQPRPQQPCPRLHLQICELPGLSTEAAKALHGAAPQLGTRLKHIVHAFNQGFGWGPGSSSAEQPVGHRCLKTAGSLCREAMVKRSRHVLSSLQMSGGC